MNAKTTIELPEDLMQEIKLRAVRERKKLKDKVADMLRFSIEHEPPPRPLIPKPLRLRGGFKPTVEDIEAAINYGRD